MATKKISELPVTTHSNLTSNARLLVNEVNSNSSSGYTTKQVSIAELNAELMEDYNYITSSNINNYLNNNSSELPEYSGADLGKALMINNLGELQWGAPSDFLPAGDNGQILSWETGSLEWIYPTGDSGDSDNTGFDTSNLSDGDLLQYSSSCGPIRGVEASELISNYLDISNASDRQFLMYTNDSGLQWSGPINTNDASDGDYLKYSSESGLIWYDPLNIYTASSGLYLAYAGDSGVYWSDPLNISTASSGQYLAYAGDSGVRWSDPIDTSSANNGDYLKYSSDSGLIWENPTIDTSSANDGDYLKYNSNSGLMWGIGIPDTDSANSGDVLTYIYDCGGPLLQWGSPGGSLAEVPEGENPLFLGNYVPNPSDNADYGKTLVIDSCGYWGWWRAMPDPSSAQTGDVLTINSNGEPEWVTPSV